MVTKLKARFINAPRWIPIVGSDAITSIEAAISGFGTLRKQLLCGIKKAEEEHDKSVSTVNDYQDLIKQEEEKQSSLSATKEKAHVIIGNIQKFLGEST